MVPFEMKGFFQTVAQFSKGPIGLVRLMEGVAGRMDFIDRQMQMHIVGVMVQDAHPLMCAESQSVTDARFDRAQRLGRGQLTRPETDDQMVRLIRLGPGVERLGIQHFKRRGVVPVALAVRFGQAWHATAAE